MKLAGSELDPNFTDELRDRIKDESLEEKQNAKMMKQMLTDWNDIEISDQTMGFDKMSLESFRQDLSLELKDNLDKYKNIPNAVYTGFNKIEDIAKNEGIIALMGYPSKPSGVKDFKYTGYDLIYIDYAGNEVLLNQKEVLDILSKHKQEERYVPDGIDKGEPKEIAKLSFAIKEWLKKQAINEVETDDGTTKKTMGKESLDILQKLKTGNRDAVIRIKQNVNVEDKYKPTNYDLIVWFVVN